MFSFLKKITGIAALEDARRSTEKLQRELAELQESANKIREESAKDVLQLRAEADQLKQETEKLIKDKETAKKTNRELATENGEPYISVVDAKVNPENIRFGFFELEWNDIFVKSLIDAGFGTDHDPEEEIVDRWFRGICEDMLDAQGIHETRYGGYINTQKIGEGFSVVG